MKQIIWTHLRPIYHLVVPFDGGDHTREINLWIMFCVKMRVSLFWIYQISSYKCHLAVEDHFLAGLYSHVGHHGIINPRRTARLDWKIQSASQTKDCDLNLEQFVFWKCVWYEFCCCQCGNVCWYDMRGFLWANTFPQLEKFVVTFILSWDGPWSNKRETNLNYLWKKELIC